MSKKKVTKRPVKKAAKKSVKNTQPKKFNVKPIVENTVVETVSAGFDRAVPTLSESELNLKFFKEMAESLKDEATKVDKGVTSVGSTTAWKLLGIDEKLVSSAGDGDGFNLDEAKARIRAISEGLGRLITIQDGVSDPGTNEEDVSFYPFDETKYPFLNRFKEYAKVLIEANAPGDEIAREVKRRVRETVPTGVTKVIRFNERTGEKTPLFGKQYKPFTTETSVHDEDLKQVHVRRMVTVDPDVLENIFGLTFTMMDYVVGSDNLTEHQKADFVSEVKRVLASQYLSQVKH